MFFFLLLFILMSDIFNPYQQSARLGIKYYPINLLRYFIQVVRTIFFRGATLVNMYPAFRVVIAFRVVATIWVVSYRKRNLPIQPV